MMKRMLLLVSVVMMVLSVTAGAAVALPTQATNYWSTDATCEELGDIVIEVTNRGQFGAAKLQGTSTTLIPRWFTFSATLEGETDPVFTEGHGKRPTDVDDVCHYSWLETIEDDPDFADGTYRLEAAVGVNLVGR